MCSIEQSLLSSTSRSVSHMFLVRSFKQAGMINSFNHNQSSGSRLSIMDLVLQLDKSSLRLSALIQKVSMESLRGNVSASTCLYSVHWKWNEDVHDNLVFRLPSNPELAA